MIRTKHRTLGQPVTLSGIGVHTGQPSSLTFRPDAVAPDATDARPSFSSALEEQLGLTLTRQRRPVQVLVVDNIQRPSPD